MRNQSIIIFLLIIGKIVYSPIYGQTFKTPSTKQEPDKLRASLKQLPSIKDTIQIIGVGDIMLGTDYPSAGYLHPSKDCSPIMRNVLEHLKSADVTFGNLEGVLAGDKGTPKRCNNPDQCYVFRMPVKYTKCLTAAGFDLLSVANNHVNDFGYEGRKHTAKVLKEANLSFAGFSDTPYTIKKIDGVVYGLCAFAPHSGTADSRKINTVKAVVSKLDSIVDIVIVSFHAGAEGRNHQHVTRKTEFFYGYNRGNVYEFSHAAIDAGADVVFGHGPHVTRAIELYKGRLICYSLGNFATYRRFNLSGPNGIAPIMKVFTNRTGEFISGEIIPIYQEGEGITKIDPQKRVIKKIQELTTADFPESKLIIDNNGIIKQKE